MKRSAFIFYSIIRVLYLAIITRSYEMDPHVPNLRRRAFVGQLPLSAVALVTALPATTVLLATPAAAVLSSKYCASGVGDGCADLSQGNELIRSLQAKSAMNRDRNQRQALEAYYMKNYPDFFASVGKTLVKRQDGTFFLADDNELSLLKKQNKLTLEMPRAKGGQYSDITQKPILILKAE